MHYSYFSDCIYVEKTSEQCCLGERNSQKPKMETATTALNALRYFSGLIYVEKTSEQCYLGYHNSQKAKEGV